MAENDQEMQVFFATNRALDSNNGKEDNSPLPEPTTVHLGTAAVAITHRHQAVGEKMHDTEEYLCHRIEGSIPSVPHAEVADSQKTFDAMVKAVSEARGGGDSPEKKCSVLVFVHGFNNSFKSAIETGATLANLYSSHNHAVVPFVFSWPSLARFSEDSYRADRTYASLSGCAVARTLSALHRFMAAQGVELHSHIPVTLLTHSMGARTLHSALRSLSDMNHPAPSLLDRVMLTAADVDVHAFEEREVLESLNSLTDELHLYINKHDDVLLQALRLSDRRPRLGRRGPNETFPAPLKIPVVTVRCALSDFAINDRGKHVYYRRSVAVVKDIKAVMGGIDAHRIQHREVTAEQNGVYCIVPPEHYKRWTGAQKEGWQGRER